MNKALKTALIIGGIIVAVILILAFIPGLLWGWRGSGYGMMGSGAYGGFGIMFLMPVLWIAIVGLIVWAVVAASRRPAASDDAIVSSDSALDILKSRYARGEMNKEEFEARKKDLL